MNEIDSDRISELQIDGLYGRAKDSINSLRRKEEDLPGDHTEKMALLARMKAKIEESNANLPDGERKKLESNKKLATMLEDVINKKFELEDWLAEAETDMDFDDWVEIILSSEFDDIINAADLIGIVRGPKGPSVFAMDVTYSHSPQGVYEKMDRRRKDIDSSEALPRFTRLDFFKSERDDMEDMPIEIDDVPRFVVAVNVDDIDGEFASILKHEYGDSSGKRGLVSKPERALEKMQYKIVSELKAQSRGMLAWLKRQIEQDDGSDPQRLSRLNASLENLRPLVGHFAAAMSRIDGRYPHLDGLALEGSDKVYRSVMDHASDIPEMIPSRDQIRKIGAGVPAENARKIA